GGAPVLELAQIAQALFERAQLRVVEGAGRLLAGAGDERNRRASVAQFGGGPGPLGAPAQALGNLVRNFLGDRALNRSGRRNGHAYTCTRRGRDPRWRRALIGSPHMDVGAAILQSPCPVRHRSTHGTVKTAEVAAGGPSRHRDCVEPSSDEGVL